MVEHKYVLPVPVVGCFKAIPVEDAQHEQYKIRPAMAEPIDKIAPPGLAKERGHYHQRENDQQEGRKGQKGINGKKDPQDPAYNGHNQGRI